MMRRCLTKSVAMARDRHWLGSIERERHRSRWRGHWTVLAAIVPVALAAAALFPAAASADYTRGFHIYNFTRYPIQLESISGGQFDGTPPIGSVLQPGQGYQDFEMVWNFAAANTSLISYTVNGGTIEYANVKVLGFGETSSTCHASYGTCSAGDTTITFYDPPGSVIDIPAGEGQQQAAALQHFCNATNAATCKFTATSETNVLSPPHVPTLGYGLINDTDNPEQPTTTYHVEDSVGTSDSVEVGLKVGVEIAKVVSVEVEAKYGHEWTQEHTYGQDVHLPCEAHHACWFEVEDPVIRDTGDFTMTLGNTTWILRDVYFDSPNPSAAGWFIVKDCALGTAGCPPPIFQLGAALGGTLPVSLGRTYTPAGKSAIVEPQLRLAIAGPSTVTAGGNASYRVTLSQTESPNRSAYALAHVRVRSSAGGRPARHWALPTLGPFTSRTLKLTVAVPNNAHGSFCVAVSAVAKHAHGAQARDCTPVGG